MTTQNSLPAKTIILTGFKKALEKVNLLDHNSPAYVSAFKRLTCGAIKRSKVSGVFSPPSVEKLITALGEPLMNPIPQKGTTNLLYRFEVPVGYVASSPIARLEQIAELGFLDEVFPFGTRTGTADSTYWTIKFHAPKLGPVRTFILSFIMDGNNEVLKEWYAGEDTTHFTPTSDLATHWVYLGQKLNPGYYKNKP